MYKAALNLPVTCGIKGRSQQEAEFLTAPAFVRSDQRTGHRQGRVFLVQVRSCTVTESISGRLAPCEAARVAARDARKMSNKVPYVG